MDSALASWEIMFKITESRLLYNNTAPIGTRYTVNTDYLGHPITGISWYGAVKYCNWLTIEEGRGLAARCYTEGTEYTSWHPAHLTYAQWNDGFTDSERLQWVQNYAGFRLPMDQGNTSANYYNEFFKAASWSGTSSVLYGFGGGNISGQDANYNGSGDPYEPYTFETTPVGYYDGSNHGGSFQTRSNANQYGIFDLSGNVFEWQNDFWMDGQVYRFVRGGGWVDNSGDLANTQSPDYPDPTWCYRALGFRVVSSQP
jgi:formylglycine-generating enzyme required for sulfatase activity